MWTGILRGFCISAFFAVVLFVLIPIHVPRPAFIPGFAPPPDMWPRTVSIAGIVLGLILALMAATSRVARPVPNPEKQAAGGASAGVVLSRFALSLAAFVGFIALVPLVGFVAATVLLTAVAIVLAGERRRLMWAIVVAVILPICLALFFNSALGTQFPKGQYLSLPGL